MHDFHTINKTFELHIQFQHPSTTELIKSTSQCPATCFNNEISACCMLIFAWSRRCDKSISEYTYHMDRQEIVYIFRKRMGSVINTLYQYENESFVQRIFQSKITSQQQSVQKDVKRIHFHHFLKERRRRSQNQLIRYNIYSVVCLCAIFFRNKRGLLKTCFVLKS